MKKVVIDPALIKTLMDYCKIKIDRLESKDSYVNTLYWEGAYQAYSHVMDILNEKCI